MGMYGFDETYAFSSSMLNMELMVVLVSESAIILTSTAAAALLVVFLITGAPRLALIVALSTLMINYFLLALIPMTGLTFNNVVGVYLISSLAISVLYSGAYSHTFLLVQADNRL